jgi:hypothetical protein
MVFFTLFFVGSLIDLPKLNTIDHVFVGKVEAGGPASPRGAARRTARRTSRRVTRRHVALGTRAYALPGGCTTVVVGGATYHRCGGVYYRPYYEGSQVVYVVVDEP